MNCYTYTNGETLPGFSLNGENQKTCAFTLKIPYDWDADELINRLRYRSHADILLYSCVGICKGNTVSSVFPDNCVAIFSSEIFTLNNHNASSLEVLADEAQIVYVLFDGSELYDSSTGKYIYNNNGTLELLDQSKHREIIKETDDTLIEL